MKKNETPPAATAPKEMSAAPTPPAAYRYRVAEAVIGEPERRLVNQALDTGWVSSAGPFVVEFEQSFAEYCHSPYASSVSSGTAALHLALTALRLGPGDEVIVPAITFVATAAAVAQCGATPVIAEVDPDHWGLTPATIRPVLSPRVRAVVVVHLFGQPAPVDEIRRSFPDLLVVEDAAEAHGARLDDRAVGTLGHAGIFSFYGNKLMTTGEGGMILTDDRAVHERVRRLRNQGTDPARRYWHGELGFNYRMTNIQAALGLAQLGRLEATLAHRRRLWGWYQQQLAGTAGVIFQATGPGSSPVHWMVGLRYEPWQTYEQRDAAMEELARRGIETRPMFYPLHELPACSRFPRAEDLTDAVILARSGIVLPSSPLLGEADVAEICAEFKAVL